MVKNVNKVLVFIINVLLIVVGVLFIRDYNRNKLLTFESETAKNLQAIDSKVADVQNQILANRENKLRDLNNTPQKIIKKDVTSSTTATTPSNPSSASSAKSSSSTKTKTS
jgi:recombinational DNA repair ATPase RecF